MSDVAYEEEDATLLRQISSIPQQVLPWKQVDLPYHGQFLACTLTKSFSFTLFSVEACKRPGVFQQFPNHRRS